MKKNPNERASAQQQKAKAHRISKPEAPAPRPWEHLSVDLRKPDPQFPNVSVRWLLQAILIAFLGAAFCAWILVCFLFWQGSWQLLFHPSHVLRATPQSLSIAFQPVRFDASETGVTQLDGWWIPTDASLPHKTILVLHGANGNIGDTLPLDAFLHQQHLNVLAFDYRGYGESAGRKPSEKQMLQDADYALSWIAETKYIAARNIVIWGTNLGANLAVELAVKHPEIGGVVLDQPLQHPLDAILRDPRSRFVPARWLLSDRFDLSGSVRAMRTPSLWLVSTNAAAPLAYQEDSASKMAVWLKPPYETDPQAAPALKRWLDGLAPSSASQELPAYAPKRSSVIVPSAR